MASRAWRWLLVVAVLVAAYALAGFAGVPALVRWAVPHYAADKLERPAQVGPVRFNPFTLRLQVQDLRVDDTGGAPLLSVQRIDTGLAWRSLVRFAWSVSHLHIDGLHVHLAIAPDGRFNLLQVIDTLQRHATPSKDDDGKMPRLVLEDIAVSQARIDWDDRQAGVRTGLTPMDLRLARLSTLPGERDAYRLTADIAGGGRLRWRGDASLNPIRANGELVLEALPLPGLSPYLKPFARVVVADGRLSATLPYRITYADGRLGAALAGAHVTLDNLATGNDAGQRFALVKSLQVTGIDADLVRRDVVLGTVKLDGGELALRRDPQGRWDLQQLLVVRKEAPASAPSPWKVAVGGVEVGGVALRVVDEQVHPAATLTAQDIALKLKLQAAQEAKLALLVEDGALQVKQLAVQQAGRPPLTLASLGIEGASLDLAQRHIAVQRIAAEGGRLRVVRDAKGQVDLAALVPPVQPNATREPGPEWQASVAELSATGWAVDVRDEGSGMQAQLLDVRLQAKDVRSDAQRPIAFQAGLRVREGGELIAAGTVTPAKSAVAADVQVRGLALAAAQPVLARHVKLKITSGALQARGRIEAAFAGKAPQVAYRGRLEITSLRLDELDGKLFARWKSVAAERVSASLRGLQVPEVRIVEPEASLIIEADRSFNAARLLVQPALPATPRPQPAMATAKAGDDAFPIQIQRVRLQDARLEFVDLSLRPQFGAKVYALGGVMTDLSTRRDTRSRVELDGRVDEFGLARVRGALNPFSPRDNTDLNVVFRNVDMVPASPYSMKFAGYRIAEGRISLDLRYRVKDSQLQGDNQVVIDRLTLGERVDSPDALQIPLQLAIAILRDADGRIDLGLPVSGSLDDPQFSYGALVWKAIVNVLTKVVTAPFRALGAALGLSGEKLEAIDFDPGSARLLPPEREKLVQVAQVLGKRAQLRLAVPGQFDEAADGAALRVQATRLAVAKRAGVDVRAGEEPGPLDFGDKKQRAAVRALFTERFGAAEWDKAKAAAEGAGDKGSVGALSRLTNLVQGEPQVADAGKFYRGLLQRLEQNAPLAPDALATLGRQRAQAVAEALRTAGVDAARVTVAAPAAVRADGRMVPLKLELAAR